MAFKICCLLLVVVAVGLNDAGVIIETGGRYSSHKEFKGAGGIEVGKEGVVLRTAGIADLENNLAGGAYAGKVDGKNIIGAGVSGEIGGKVKVQGENEAGVGLKDGKLNSSVKSKLIVDKDVKTHGKAFFGNVDRSIAEEMVKPGSLAELDNW